MSLPSHPREAACCKKIEGNLAAASAAASEASEAQISDPMRPLSICLSINVGLVLDIIYHSLTFASDRRSQFQSWHVGYSAGPDDEQLLLDIFLALWSLKDQLRVSIALGYNVPGP